MQVPAKSQLMNVSPGKSQKVQTHDFRHFWSLKQHTDSCPE